jgi:transcriptional regulator with XRE-family HTH domain
MEKELKAYFKTTGTTQTSLADKLGIHRSQITLWIYGQRRPPRKYLSKLSKITGIPVENLL